MKGYEHSQTDGITYSVLTKKQRQIWVGQQLYGALPVYNLPLTFTIRGELQPRNFQHAFQSLVNASDVFRTQIEVIDGVPRLKVLPHVSCITEIHDFSQDPDPERAGWAWIRPRMQRVFQLDECLFESALIKLAETKWIWFFNVHHIVSDGISLSLMFKRVSELYGNSLNEAAEEQIAETRYQRFVAWEGEFFHTPRHQKGKEFWSDKLSDHSESLELYGRTLDSQLVPICRAVHPLGRELTQAIYQLASPDADDGPAKPAAVFEILAATFLTYLHRISGQRQLSMGIPFHNRPPGAFKSMLGLFVEVAPLCVDIADSETFESLRKKIRRELRAVSRHVRAVPEHTLQQRPYHVMFNYHVGAFPDFHGMPTFMQWHPVGISNVGLNLNVQDFNAAGSLTLELDVNEELFDEKQRRRMLQHFLRVLDHFLKDPNQPLDAFSMLSDGEEQLVLHELNERLKPIASSQTKSLFLPGGQCLHQLIEAQAARTPEAVAVAGEHEQLSYDALNRRANQLAHYLEKHGAGPEVPIGLCVDRSPDMVVGLLGILKAGGAYVPLDPNAPRERLALMASNADLRLVVTQEKLQESLSHLEAQRICLDADWSAVSQEAKSAPVVEVSADSLAYVIYTSGSTGRPKGVAVEHRQVVNYVQGVLEKLALPDGASFATVSPLTADLGNTMLYPALVTGGTLQVVAEDRATDPDALGAYFKDCQPDCLKIVPSHLETLMMGSAPADVLPHKRLVVGGEACPWHLVERVQSLRPECRIINHYGPTETTVGVATHQVEVSGQNDSPSRCVPIGRPLANSQIYVLDAHMNPVPLRVDGEVYIGGDGLARGYMGAPGMTAEKFLPHPFSDQPGARLYRTGDRARFRPDGTLEFLGRVDHQVKLRGYRVELGEIETVLGDHLSMPVAVKLHEDETRGSQRLIAYVGGEQDRLPAFAEIKAFLRLTLPEHMIPENLVILDSLPMLPNGKIDRHALPDPEGVPDGETEWVAPRNLKEEIVAVIWADVLQRERVSVHDSFFDLGGHSLLATQVVSRIREAFHIEFPIRTFFAGPTVAGLVASIETIRDAGPAFRTPPLVPTSREAPVRLSFAQQRLWFLQQLDPASVAYNVPMALRLEGGLDTMTLERALAEVVRRHDSLRTIFTMTDKHPVQRATAAVPFALPVIDLQSASDPESEARRLAAEEAARPFNLSSGPHFRTQLLRLGPEDHVLLMTLHHIVSDAWTRGVLCRELSALYEAYLDNQPSPLAPLPVQYADFAHWQRQWFTGEVLEQQLSYWRDQLADLTPLELPMDRPRPAIQTDAGAAHAISLGHSLTAELRALSRKSGVTLAITLLAAFKLLLARYTGQKDLAVGSPIANRNRREVEGLIGLFVNTLVMRTDLSGDPSFREIIARVQEVALGAYDHQDLPFEQLVEELQPERDSSRNPLFQVMFAMQNAPSDALALSGVTVQPLGLEIQTTHFDLECHLWERSDGVEIGFVYNTDLFEPSTIDRLGGHFHRTLEAVAREPARRLSQIPLIDDTERQQLLVGWNATGKAYPRDATLVERFEVQVAATPDAVALVFEGQQLTYAQLDARANRLGQYLRQRHGVGPEVCVGLGVERSLEMVVAILGILKAGGAYVPLDPGAPPERLAFMLKDADIALVLTRGTMKAKLPADWVGAVIDLDVEGTAIAEMSDARVTSGVTAESLAYIMYTSGSTGLPKGTSVCQRNVVRLVTNTDYCSFGATDALLQLAPLAFDASTLELWGSLLNGARLVIFPPHQPTLEELGEFIQEHGITTLWLTAALFHQMVDSQLDVLSGVRQILAGGDVLSVPHAQRMVANLRDGGRLINGYGPTENTTFTCCHVMTRESQLETSVPIGRPIANTQVYVLDESMEPVPVGVYGELYIGGDGLARSYLRRPGLTAERFVPHPFSTEPGARLYRSGDLVRYRPAGTLEFKGRQDGQVKVRGYRIELGEVEAVLAEHGGVRECVAWVREDEPGEKQLVAYVVPVRQLVSPNALREHLQQRLPDYMVPQRYVTLDTLPLTPNGKVDRRALPAPESVRPDLDTAYETPRHGTEQILAQLWKQVLRIDQVGRQDNFFELGGDSILSIQIVAKASQAGLRITPRQLFQHQTIAELATVAGTLEMGTADQGAVTGPLPLLPVQHWFFDQEVEKPEHWNMSWVLEAKQPIDAQKLERVAEFLLVHHDALRLRFVHNGDGWQQEMVAPSAGAPFVVVDLSRLAPEAAEAQFTQEAERLQSSLSLSEGPLVRVALFRFGEEQLDRVLLVIHHLAVDGISWRILLDDLQTAYGQLCEGKTMQLPLKTTSFKEWAERLVEHAQSDALQEEASYWRAVADTPWTPLRRDFADGVNTVASTRTVSVVLGQEDTQALLQEVPEVYQTRINDVLLAALLDVLALWSQQDTLSLHLEGHGREELLEGVDLSRTVGWFTSIFPVVLKNGHPADPGELLKSVKEQLRQIPRKGVGYGLLRYLSQIGEAPGQLGKQPDPEVAFNYLGQFDQVISSDGRWQSAGAGTVANRDPGGKQQYLLTINALVMGGALQVHWNYSDAVYRRDTIETLANNYLTALLKIIRHCQSPNAGGYTPSDFPLAGISQADLEKIQRA